MVFVDQKSGFTYQLGNEIFTGEEQQVTLTELKEAQFFEADKFACGEEFVVGESCIK